MKALRITVSALALALFAAVMLVAFFARRPASRAKAPESERPPLVFSEDGKFTVLHLTDFHEWLGVEGEGLLNVARRDGLKPLLEDFIVSSLDSVDPDLVVLGGDNVFPLSFWYDIGENSISLATYRAIAEVFEARSQYWTLTFGNHDSESFMNKTDFLDVLEEYSYSPPPKATRLPGRMITQATFRYPYMIIRVPKFYITCLCWIRVRMFRPQALRILASPRNRLSGIWNAHWRSKPPRAILSPP